LILLLEIKECFCGHPVFGGLVLNTLPASHKYLSPVRKSLSLVQIINIVCVCVCVCVCVYARNFYL